jgi:hypothetical protein
MHAAGDGTAVNRPHSWRLTYEYFGHRHLGDAFLDMLTIMDNLFTPACQYAKM